MSVVRRAGLSLALAFLAAVVLAGCGAGEGARDGAGMTEEESLGRSLEVQYALAGERSVAL